MLPSRRFSGAPQTTARPAAAGPDRPHRTHRAREKPQAARGACHGQSTPTRLVRERSEEHTSELQSRLHLVCRLLLEKKKKTEQHKKKEKEENIGTSMTERAQ